VQADLLPSLGNTVWDTSFLLSERSIPGQVVPALTGYVAQPAGIQVVFYVATLLIIGTLMRWVGGADGSARPRPAKTAPAE